MNKLAQSRRGLALVLAAGAALQFAYGLADRAPDFDEAIYMGLARGIARTGLPLVVENGPVFLLHPPLFYYLESIPYLIGEPPLLIARLPSTVLSLLTLGLLYEICLRAWNPRRALAAAALLAVNPAFVYYSHSVYMEPTVACLGMLALALWVRSPPEGPRAAWAGLAGGGAFLAKYLGAFFPLAILAAATPLAGRPRYGAACRLLLAFLCTAAAWPLFALLLDPHDFLEGLAFFLSAPPAAEAAHSWRVDGVMRYVAAQVGVLTPALVVLAGAGVTLDFRGTRQSPTSPETRGVLVAATMVLLMFSLFCLLAGRRDVKYFVPALPLLALFGARPLLALLDRCRSVAARAAAGAACALLLSPMTWLFHPGDRSWHPNIVVFGLQRDGRYRDLARLGARIRQERSPGARVITEAKSSVVGYYGDLEAIDIWGLPWPNIAQRVRGADYYVTASDANYLDAEAVHARDALLAAEFEPVISLHSGGITQSLHRRKRPPGAEGDRQGRAAPDGRRRAPRPVARRSRPAHLRPRARAVARATHATRAAGNRAPPCGVQTCMKDAYPSGPVDPGKASGECYFRDKTLLPGRGHAWQAHDHAVLTLVVHGRLDETFANQEQRCPGWAMHYKPRGAMHSTSAGPAGVRMFLVGVRGASGAGPASGGADRPRLLGGGARAARALTAFLLLERAGGTGSEVGQEALLTLWDSLARRPAGESEAWGRPPTWLSEVRERILSGREFRARLARVAAEFRVHPAYLARAFRRSYGCSIGEVRRRARTDRAVERLAREDTPLCEMALDLGYADQSHFTREFRRETGWTPRRFRKTAVSLARPRVG